MLKTVFIAHQISGDVEANIKKVLAICKELHESNEVLPIFPSLVWRQYLPDNESTKYRAGLVNEEYFRRGMVDEVWLYGDVLSDGMKKEIRLAQTYGIPVIAKTEAMVRALKEFK